MNIKAKFVKLKKVIIKKFNKTKADSLKIPINVVDPWPFKPIKKREAAHFVILEAKRRLHY